MITQKEITNNIADNFKEFGGYLECEQCGRIQSLKNIGEHLSTGWPKCCGYTMRWITKQVKES